MTLSIEGTTERQAFSGYGVTDTFPLTSSFVIFPTTDAYNLPSSSYTPSSAFPCAFSRVPGTTKSSIEAQARDQVQRRWPLFSHLPLPPLSLNSLPLVGVVRNKHLHAISSKLINPISSWIVEAQPLLMYLT